MRYVLSLLLLELAFGGLADADAPDRWVPRHCLEYGADDSQLESGLAMEPESQWNHSYGAGFRAAERGEYHVAEQEMCRALLAARRFGPRDWRFAETLDELGLIAYGLRDFDAAELAQGAAIAELLLAVGPHGEPLDPQKISDQSPVRADCRSGLAVYTTRLGWIHERSAGRISTPELERAPWKIFAAGYLPLDRSLGRRLDWLVSQYLLEENLLAAKELTELQRQILTDEP